MISMNGQTSSKQAATMADPFKKPGLPAPRNGATGCRPRKRFCLTKLSKPIGLKNGLTRNEIQYVITELSTARGKTIRPLVIECEKFPENKKRRKWNGQVRRRENGNVRLVQAKPHFTKIYDESETAAPSSQTVESENTSAVVLPSAMDLHKNVDPAISSKSDQQPTESMGKYLTTPTISKFENVSPAVIVIAMPDLSDYCHTPAISDDDKWDYFDDITVPAIEDDLAVNADANEVIVIDDDDDNVAIVSSADDEDCVIVDDDDCVIVDDDDCVIVDNDDCAIVDDDCVIVDNDDSAFVDDHDCVVVEVVTSNDGVSNISDASTKNATVDDPNIDDELSDFSCLDRDSINKVAVDDGLDSMIDYVIANDVVFEYDALYEALFNYAASKEASTSCAVANDDFVHCAIADKILKVDVPQSDSACVSSPGFPVHTPGDPSSKDSDRHKAKEESSVQTTSTVNRAVYSKQYSSLGYVRVVCKKNNEVILADKNVSPMSLTFKDLNHLRAYLTDIINRAEITPKKVVQHSWVLVTLRVADILGINETSPRIWEPR